MLILLLCFPFYAHQEHCRQTFSVLQGVYGASTIDKTPKHQLVAVGNTNENIKLWSKEISTGKYIIVVKIPTYKGFVKKTLKKNYYI